MIKVFVAFCVGALLTAMYVEFYYEPEIVYECTEEQQQEAAVKKLALIIDGDLLGYAPKPKIKPRER